MKNYILPIALMAILSNCTNPDFCDKAESRNNQIEHEIQAIKNQQDQLLKREVGLNIDNDDDLIILETIEDQIIELTIQQAMLEIEQEQLKKESPCI